MLILSANLSIVFIFCLFARFYGQTYVTEGVVREKITKPNPIWLILAIMSLILVSGLRANIGDTAAYIRIFTHHEFTWEYIISHKDIGFGILQQIIKHYISTDPIALLLVTALVTNMLIGIMFYQYSRFVEVSFYVYITGGLFLVSMNGIRQMLAAAIAFMAFKYLIKADFKKYACLVLIASLFHSSALILIPVYFVARLPAWSMMTMLLLSLSVIGLIALTFFSNILFALLEGTSYGHYENFHEGGANILRVIVFATPILIAFMGRERLREVMPFSDYMVNMALIGLLFMVLSLGNWIFARVSLYFELYHILLISWIVPIFAKKNRYFVYFSLLACYLVYFYVEHVLSLNIQYESPFLGW